MIFALLGDWHNRSLRQLPLLSKITLVAAARRLEQMGFRPSVALIGLCSRLDAS
jgi:hypothetical protein